MAKPNYSFEKRQREIAKKKKKDEKDARKREAREAARGTTSGEDAERKDQD
ncbi:hypothetical protein [Luteimonas lutimaris]|uniref:Uncharacterized protein n=1 Tax=Luteimonas lutimaris TaxID=698645 RepID=A0ABP7MCI9_9GAMM|nr:hypothetical protein [Luteimonas sp.]